MRTTTTPDQAVHPTEHTGRGPLGPRRARAGHLISMIGLAALSGALVLGGLMLAAGPAGAATSITVNQCSNILASPEGATTGMSCSVVVVNTISHGVSSSVTTVTRNCSLGPCPPGNGTFTSHSTSLVTRVEQCNGSGNDAAHRTDCTVSITNNISADTPGAQPVTAATADQCVGSGQGGGGTVNCDPYPASTTGATITQCNGSGNGGGGTVDCTILSTSKVSRAIPVTVDQCNGTANPGGSVLACSASIVTNITAATAAAPTASGTTAGAASSTPAQVSQTPVGGVAAGDGTSSPVSLAWLTAGALLLVTAAALAVVSTQRFHAGDRGRHE